MYYSHYTDSVVEEVHSIPITPGLTPVAFLQNNQKTYLGHPFTDCILTEAHNDYSSQSQGYLYGSLFGPKNHPLIT